MAIKWRTFPLLVAIFCHTSCIHALQSTLPYCLLKSFTGTSVSSYFPMEARVESRRTLFVVNAKSDNTETMEANVTGRLNGTEEALVNALGDDDENDDKTVEGIAVPRPPDDLPKLALLAKEYDALRDQSDKTTFLIDELSSRASDLQRQLQMRQQELSEGRKEWGLEKASFLEKIAELTGIIDVNSEMTQDERESKQRLEKEVKLLQNQIVQVNMALKKEQKASKELRERLEDVNDAMEFEQMNFDKERLALQEKLQEEKERLKEVQKQWDEDKKRFESTQGVVQQQLAEEKERLQKAQLAWAENQIDYEEQQAGLRRMLEDQKTRLKETEAFLESERVQFGEERSALKSVIEADRLKLEEIERTLEDERLTFQAAQADLEQKILDEQDRVDALYTRLAEEQERFYMEKDNLETSLELERKRVQSVESNLAEEKESFEVEKAKLQEEIDEQVRINRLKKKQMANRYQAIRAQLTGLWEGAKRDAREERKQLTAKYEGKLTGMSQKVSELETNLFNARKSNEELASVLNDLQAQKDKAKDETEQVETRYITMLSQRNREIAELKIGIDELKQTVAQREDQLLKYESSFRELVKLGVRVTGNKLKGGRSRISGWFRQGKKGDETTVE